MRSSMGSTSWRSLMMKRWQTCLQWSSAVGSAHCLVQVINQSVHDIRYEEDQNTKDFAARYPFHHEEMLVPIIDIVDDEFAHYCTHMKMRIGELAQEGDKDAHWVLSLHMNIVMSAQGIIQWGTLPNFFCNVRTGSMQRKLEQSRASVGSAICQLASILSQMHQLVWMNLIRTLMYSSHRETYRQVQTQPSQCLLHWVHVE